MTSKKRLPTQAVHGSVLVATWELKNYPLAQLFFVPSMAITADANNSRAETPPSLTRLLAR